MILSHRYPIVSATMDLLFSFCSYEESILLVMLLVPIMATMDNSLLKTKLNWSRSKICPNIHYPVHIKSQKEELLLHRKRTEKVEPSPRMNVYNFIWPFTSLKIQYVKFAKGYQFLKNIKVYWKPSGPHVFALYLILLTFIHLYADQIYFLTMYVSADLPIFTQLCN